MIGGRQPSPPLAVVHIDNNEYADGCMFIIDKEINSVILPISPHIQEKQISVKVAGIRLCTVGGIVSEGIVHLGNGVFDKILYSFLAVSERGRPVK
jgi:hypothetical protein